MIQVIVGKKGTGKTKTLIGMANDAVKDSKGEIVFITPDTRRMIELNHRIRLINTWDFKVEGWKTFYAFLCGIIAENYDIDQIYIDGLLELLRNDFDNIEVFMFDIKKLSDKYNIRFTISMSGDPESVPAFLKKYIA